MTVVVVVSARLTCLEPSQRVNLGTDSMAGLLGVVEPAPCSCGFYRMELAIKRLSRVTKQFGLPLSFMQDALEVAQGMRLEQTLLAGEFKGLHVAAMIEQVPTDL